MRPVIPLRAPDRQPDTDFTSFRAEVRCAIVIEWFHGAPRQGSSQREPADAISCGVKGCREVSCALACVRRIDSIHTLPGVLFWPGVWLWFFVHSTVGLHLRSRRSHPTALLASRPHIRPRPALPF